MTFCNACVFAVAVLSPREDASVKSMRLKTPKSVIANMFATPNSHG